MENIVARVLTKYAYYMSECENISEWVSNGVIILDIVEHCGYYMVKYTTDLMIETAKRYNEKPFIYTEFVDR